MYKKPFNWKKLIFLYFSVKNPGSRRILTEICSTPAEHLVDPPHPPHPPFTICRRIRASVSTTTFSPPRCKSTKCPAKCTLYVLPQLYLKARVQCLGDFNTRKPKKWVGGVAETAWFCQKTENLVGAGVWPQRCAWSQRCNPMFSQIHAKLFCCLELLCFLLLFGLAADICIFAASFITPHVIHSEIVYYSILYALVVICKSILMCL